MNRNEAFLNKGFPQRRESVPTGMSYRYHIVVQRDVFPGETFAVTIYVEKGSQQMTTDEEGNQFNPFPIDVTLDVKDGRSDRNLISTVNRQLTRRQSTTIFVKVEANLDYDVALIVSLSFRSRLPRERMELASE